MNERLTLALALAFALLLPVGCTGGSETSAAEEEQPAGESATQSVAVDARTALDAISPAIPVYQGAQYREDLTSRDLPMIRNRYGANAEVFTLASDDSYPQVFHYYTTYLGQFRGFPSRDTYPGTDAAWRTFEVPLHEVMKDPFIPTMNVPLENKQVILQIAETEAEPKTVIRYIVTPAQPNAPQEVAAATPDAAAAATR
jgi:hypothetical protein